MNRQRDALGLLAAVVVLAACLVGCGSATEVAAPTAAARSTSPPIPANLGPPDVDNDAPAGICEGTANILSRVDRDADSLFRAVAVDNRVGGNDGDGIRGVRFVVVGDNLTYAKDETAAPYCIFGGNEPGCGPWPRDEAGRYTWGVGGSPVEPGRYEVFVEVIAAQPDSRTGRDRCDWSFAMTVLPR